MNEKKVPASSLAKLAELACQLASKQEALTRSRQ